MKIYTRGGDKGSTQIYADKPMRVDKDDIILACYGDLDELNSHIGLLISLANDVESTTLHTIQRQLFQAGFAISATSSLSEEDVSALESAIDRLTHELAPQTQFILPGGCQAAAQAHVCRAVCRRTERTITALKRVHDVPDVLAAYINRLSDYLFTLARTLNHRAGLSDTSL
ncbi:cob(I)yrinic acid a,c-diamide adenosyltransferase [Alteromonas sp. CYL-A6]|uniref:cob(I)yrinic acid a,c-diamide adenosyltransferase n=1 Tax=Alteromonas nitratireducens TaxID=3390813 RepID=UPI0034C1B403